MLSGMIIHVIVLTRTPLTWIGCSVTWQRPCPIPWNSIAFQTITCVVTHPFTYPTDPCPPYSTNWPLYGDTISMDSLVAWTLCLDNFWVPDNVGVLSMSTHPLLAILSLCWHVFKCLLALCSQPSQLILS